MPHLSFAELIKHRVPLTAAEAVDLTLAVAHLLDTKRVDDPAAQVPGDGDILLGNTGQVTFTTVGASTDRDETAALAALLRRLLQLDESGQMDRRGRVPGGLLVLISRALRNIDLPVPTAADFRTALSRFATEGAPAAATLSVIFWRAASLRPAIDKKRVELLPPAEEPEPPPDRRSQGPSRTALRRALRDLEREVFESGSDSNRPIADVIIDQVRRPERPRPKYAEARGAVAGALVGSMLVAIVTSSGVLDRVFDPAEPILPEPPIAAWFRAGSPPRSVPVLTRALVGQDAFSPSFGPGGSTILFHAGHTGAPLMRAAMTKNGEVAGVTKLLDDGASNSHVSMSPDGTKIVFDSDRDGMRGVYVADADGRNAQRISGPGEASAPSWSPDGLQVAFVRAEPSRPSVWNVWIVQADGGDLRRVTAHTFGQPLGASWFPDGKRLAYSRGQQLVITDLDTHRSTIVASPRPGHLVRTPAVSPDGSRVVFQVQRDGAWILDVNRMMLRRILRDPSAEDFVWSPNGRTIAYHARSEGGWGVWTIRDVMPR